MTDNDLIITIDIDVFPSSTERAPLLKLFLNGGNEQPGRAYLRLTENGYCELDIRAPSDNGTPRDEWHGVTNAWELPGEVRGDALHRLLTSEETLQLLQRVYEGHEVDWDGRNHVGELDDDAAEASAELAELFQGLHDECWRVWNAEEYLAESSLGDLWPSGRTLCQAIDAILAEASEEGIYCDEAELQSALLDKLQAEVDSDEGFQPTVEQRAALAWH